MKSWVMRKPTYFSRFDDFKSEIVEMFVIDRQFVIAMIEWRIRQSVREVIRSGDSLVHHSIDDWEQLTMALWNAALPQPLR